MLLQLVQTLATLYLPTLNADIIDNGVVTGDTGYILHTGALMLAVTLVQIVCAIGAVYFGARTAMALRPRPARRRSSAGCRRFSAREVGRFGAPSLITRTTNDVQQVQMLVLMTCTLMVVGADHVRRRHHHGARQDVGLSWLLAGQRAACWPSSSG